MVRSPNIEHGHRPQRATPEEDPSVDEQLAAFSFATHLYCSLWPDWFAPSSSSPKEILEHDSRERRTLVAAREFERSSLVWAGRATYSLMHGHLSCLTAWQKRGPTDVYDSTGSAHARAIHDGRPRGEYLVISRWAGRLLFLVPARPAEGYSQRVMASDAVSFSFFLFLSLIPQLDSTRKRNTNYRRQLGPRRHKAWGMICGGCRKKPCRPSLPRQREKGYSNKTVS
jgi:hypothetical protein